MSSPLFRSLPSELQYELVGDMRAASRGTSYKRLQSMLQTSPTPIDFSKAQVANLKTRNELTQRVLEVTDEIGDAHIKVPIRVAGERNREYVLVRKEGDEGGFVLGVRNKEGSSADKAIVVGGGPGQVEISSDEDSDDQRDRPYPSPRRKRYDDDDDIELDEVEVPASASPRRPATFQASRSPSNAFQASDANNPEVRRALAEQLLTKRAEEHIREKMREKGIVNEDEVLEEQLRAAHQRLKEGGRGGLLFAQKRQGRSHDRRGSSAVDRRSDSASSLVAAELAAYYDQDSGEDDGSAESEVEVLGESSSRSPMAQGGFQDGSSPERSISVSGDEENLEEATRARAPSEQSVGDEGVALENFDASAYASLYDTEPPQEDDVDLEEVELEEGRHKEQAPVAGLDNQSTMPAASEALRTDPVLGFRRSDRPGLPGRLDPKLFERRKWSHESSLDTDPKHEEVPHSVPLEPVKPVKQAVTDLGKNGLPARAAETVFKAAASESPSKDLASGPAKSSPLKSSFTASDLAKSPLDSPFKNPLPKVKQSPKASMLFASPRNSSPSKMAQKPPNSPKVSAAGPARDVDSKSDSPPKDAAGRPAAEIAPLPVGDDLAATQMLNEDLDPQTPPTHVETIVPKQEPDDAVEMTDLPSEPEVSHLEPSESQAQKAAGVDESEILAPIRSTSPFSGESLPDNDDAQSQGQPKRETEREQPTSRGTTASLDVADSTRASEVTGVEDPPMDNYQEGPGGASPMRSDGMASDRGRKDTFEYDSDSATPVEWSPSPSPEPRALGPDGFPLPTAEELETMDAEYEEEAQALRADQNDIASFISNTKGQGLIEAQAQLAREVEALRAEHVNTKKSEEEITRQMAREIQMMLRLFGLPYITAPMEAEAQCAELVSQKLVDGIITDDSDVFLFGGTRVYKNMFNNNKVVECFLLSDIQRKLGLDREKLVRLAYLLGSDYTEGLPSVGPVVAMEVLSLFTGPDGLLRFKDWWLKVQAGQDTPQDTRGKTMRRIKKTLANKVHLNEDWPNPAVLDAYYEPSVDSSDEPFQWGLPDLDNLRAYLGEYLGWPTTKTDQYVVPVIEAQSRRSRARGNQSTLDRNGFFDVSGGTGVYAGRTLPKYGSSRLQNVVDGFRAANDQRAKQHPAGNGRSVQPLAQRNEVEVLSSDEEHPSPQNPAVALNAVGEVVTEEAIGKEMGKSRPVVRREQMRVTRDQAEAELDANIVALEGDKSLSDAAGFGTAPKAAKKRKGAAMEGSSASAPKKQQRSRARKDQDKPTAATSSASENGEDEEEWQPGATTGRASRGRGSRSARGRGTRGRGRGSAAPTLPHRTTASPDTQPPGSNAGAENGGDPSSVRGARTRKPARARGARGRGGRHPHLAAGRTMRLDGPIPESIAEPLRPGRHEEYQQSRMRSMSRSTSASSLTPSTRATPVGVGNNTAARPQRVHIDIDSDDEDD